MQREARDEGRKGSGDAGQGRGGAPGGNRRLSCLRDKDVQDIGEKIATNPRNSYEFYEFFCSFRGIFVVLWKYVASNFRN